MSNIDDISTNEINQYIKINEDIDYLFSKVGYIKSVANKLYRIRKRINILQNNNKTEYIKKKMTMIMLILKYINTQCDTTSTFIYGSFVRNLIERIFVTEDDTSGYSNSKHHDINICIYDDKNDYITKYKYFNKFIQMITSLSEIYNLVNYKLAVYSFNGYYITKIENITNTYIYDGDKLINDVPHYIIYMKDETGDVIQINLMTYWIYANTNFINDVNSLYIDIQGIKSSMRKANFFDIINNIKNRVALCYDNFNLNNINSINGLRTKKEKYLKEMIYYLNNQTKIHEVGYNKIYSLSGYPIYNIETKEECILSGCEPPYINLKLECGHDISIMAFTGIVNIRNSEYIESINCPYCKKSLCLKLSIFLPPVLNIPTNNNYYKNNNNKSIKNYEKSRIIMSEDNIKYMEKHNTIPDYT